MKISRCLVDEVTVDLTCMASLIIGDGVRNHFQPIITKSFKLVSELRSELVSSAHTVMSSLSASCACLCERHRSRILS